MLGRGFVAVVALMIGFYLAYGVGAGYFAHLAAPFNLVAAAAVVIAAVTTAAWIVRPAIGRGSGASSRDPQ